MTPEGRALAAAAIHRCPALLGRSISGFEANAAWLAERARIFIASSSASSSPSRGRRRAQNQERTPLLLVAEVARRFPQALSLALANLDGKMDFLINEVGMSEGEAAGVVVSRMPQLLGLRMRSLRMRAVFLLDGNDDEEVEEGEGGEEETGREARIPATAADADDEGDGEEEEQEEEEEQGEEEGGRRRRAEAEAEGPIRGRRSPAEIARFSPCLASSFGKLVARHAAAAEALRRDNRARRRKKQEEKKKKMPSLSSLLACTDEVLEGRLGLPSGYIEKLKSSRRVMEAIERAERVAASMEEEEEEEEREGEEV